MDNNKQLISEVSDPRNAQDEHRKTRDLMLQTLRDSVVDLDENATIAVGYAIALIYKLEADVEALQTAMLYNKPFILKEGSIDMGALQKEIESCRGPLRTVDYNGVVRDVTPGKDGRNG